MRAAEKLFYFTFILLLIAFPFSRKIAAGLELILVIATLLNLRQVNFKALLKAYKPLILLSSIFLAHLIALLYSDDLKYGIEFLVRNHRFVIYPFIIIVHATIINQYFPRFLAIFGYGNVVASVITLGLYLSPEPFVIELTRKFGFMMEYPIQSDRVRYGLYSPFIDHIQFSDLISIAIISFLYLCLSKYFKWHYVWAALFLLFTATILGGRGGQIGLLAALSTFSLGIAIKKIQPKLALKLGSALATITIVLFVFIGMAGAPFLLYTTVPPVQKRYDLMVRELTEFSRDKNKQGDYEHKTAVRRIISWQNHWEAIKKQPILGAGTGDYYTEIEKIYATDPYDVPVNSHSQYFQYWLAIGAWGLALFLYIIGNWIVKIASNTLEYIYALAFIVFYLVAFIPDALMLRQVDNMAFSLFFSLIGYYCLQIKWQKIPSAAK